MIGDPDVRAVLDDGVAALLERHVGKAKEWFPHEFRTPVDPGAPVVAEADAAGLRSALFVNLLTEDNLPAYTSELDRWFGRESSWGAWTRRWTAEEGRHSIAMREWVHAVGVIDAYELERARMAVVLQGVDDHGANVAEAVIYVTIQELATRVAHANTGHLIADDVGRRLMQRIAIDENHHFLFYRDLTKVLVTHLPSDATIALSSVVRTFQMPGVGIPGFRQHAAVIADAGIYSWSIHLNEVLNPILRFWGIDSLVGLSADAEVARERLFSHVDRIRRVADRQASMSRGRSGQPLLSHAQR